MKGDDRIFVRTLSQVRRNWPLVHVVPPLTVSMGTAAQHQPPIRGRSSVLPRLPHQDAAAVCVAESCFGRGMGTHPVVLPQPSLALDQSTIEITCGGVV